MTEEKLDPLYVSKHFTWKEALWLPQWNRLASEQDGLTEEIKEELRKVFVKLEIIRDKCGGRPIIIHCAFRPALYNKLVKGAAKSAHLSGKAIDFHIQGLRCDDVRAGLKPLLEELGIRMEWLDGANWVHIDTATPIGSRYFKP